MDGLLKQLDMAGPLGHTWGVSPAARKLRPATAQAYEWLTGGIKVRTVGGAAAVGICGFLAAKNGRDVPLHDVGLAADDGEKGALLLYFFGAAMPGRING